MTSRQRHKVVARAVSSLQRGNAKARLIIYRELLDGVLAGDPAALTALGTFATYRIVHADEAGFAYACYCVAAKNGDRDAQYNLGSALIEGHGVSKDVASGLRWLRRAERNGSFEATNYLGFCRRHGIGVRRDIALAFKLSMRAAEHEVPSAQFQVGTCLLRGIGVAADKASGMKWIRRAARNGDAEAIRFMSNRKDRRS